MQGRNQLYTIKSKTNGKTITVMRKPSLEVLKRFAANHDFDLWFKFTTLKTIKCKEFLSFFEVKRQRAGGTKIAG